MAGRASHGDPEVAGLGCLGGDPELTLSLAWVASVAQAFRPASHDRSLGTGHPSSPGSLAGGAIYRRLLVGPLTTGGLIGVSQRCCDIVGG